MKKNDALRALVHQVKLNERGWPDKVLQAWVETAFFYKDGYSFTALGEISEFLKREFERKFSELELERTINSLANKSIIIKTRAGWKLSEQRIQEVNKQLREAATLEEEVQRQWFTELQQKYPGLDSEILPLLWKELIDGFVGPLFLNYGAEAICLITGTGSFENEEILGTVRSLLDGCVNKFNSNQQLQVREILLREFPNFVNPPTPQRRNYLISLVDYVLAHYAVGLDKATLDKIYTKPINMQLLLDTNFLFSILDLHENPLNEAAKAMLSGVKKLGGKVTVKLYVADKTLREFQESIRRLRDELARHRWTRELSAAAVRAGELPSATLTYLKRNLEKPIEPETYFKPYEAALQILKARGIELYNEKFDRLRMDQAVIDDIHDYQNHLASRKEPRGWDTIEHDVMLWHIVREKRPAGDSALDARVFILTCDYRFIHFDVRKRRQLKFGIPICLLPGQFLQMIRYFVPHTEDFDTAFLQSLRMPILSPFDPEKERLTLQILETLTRIKEISEDENTAYAILTDQVLRQALSETSSDEEQVIELIESTVARKLQEKEKEIEELAAEKRQEARRREGLEQSVATLDQQLKQKDEELLHVKAKEETLKKKVNKLTERLRKQEEIQQQEAARRKKVQETWQAFGWTLPGLATATAVPYAVVTMTPLPAMLSFIPPRAYYIIAYIATLAILHWKVWPPLLTHYPILQKLGGTVLKWLLLVGGILQAFDIIARLIQGK